MPRVAVILRFSAVALLLSWAAAGSVFATSLRKFDEFGMLSHCDLTARLDNFAINLQETPTAYGQIISYAPPGRGERLLELIKDYLVNMRGLAPRRVKTNYGGRNSDPTEPKIELWIIPKNVRPVEPLKFETDVETFKGLFIDVERDDDFGVESESEMGPGIGGTSDAAFADMLNQQKSAIGYLVVYSGEDLTPGAWKNIAQQEISDLQEFKVEISRVKVVFGGHQKKTRVQYWILPKDAPPPVPDAGAELPLAKTVKVRDFYAYELGSEQNQKNVFTRLKEILTADKTVRAFLVVRLETPTTVDEAEPGEAKPDAAPVVDNEPVSEPVEEREPADLTKLVEKWRAELANTHKISADRFIVLFTTAGEADSSYVSLWIVPKGQPLPNPNEEEEPAEDTAKDPGVDRP